MTYVQFGRVKICKQVNTSFYTGTTQHKWAQVLFSLLQILNRSARSGMKMAFFTSQLFIPRPIRMLIVELNKAALLSVSLSPVRENMNVEDATLQGFAAKICRLIRKKNPPTRLTWPFDHDFLIVQQVYFGN